MMKGMSLSTYGSISLHALRLSHPNASRAVVAKRQSP